MFHGHSIWIPRRRWKPAPFPDVLFERGLYWASGRSGVVNLVAAHKWFNLAALKGRADAIPLRREVAETDVRGRDRHGPARGPRLDHRALRHLSRTAAMRMPTPPMRRSGFLRVTKYTGG